MSTMLQPEPRDGRMLVELLILEPTRFRVFIESWDEWEEVKKLAQRRAPRHAYIVAEIRTADAPKDE